MKRLDALAIILFDEIITVLIIIIIIRRVHNKFN